MDLVPLHELIDAVLDGKIEDAKTVVGAWPAIASRIDLVEPNCNERDGPWVI